MHGMVSDAFDDAAEVSGPADTNLGELATTLPIFGHRVTFRTNSPRIHDLIKEYYGQWAQLPGDLVSDATFVISVTLRPHNQSPLTEPHDGQDGTREITYHLPSVNQLYISTTGGSAHVDVDRGLARADVTSDVVDRAELFETGLLNTMTLMLVTSRDRCPVHAAAVVVNDHVVLLAGSSGTGKSTLAYAFQSEGFEVLSDDTVYVQLHPVPRLWFLWKAVGLLPAVADQFRGLRDIAPSTLSTGKTKVVVPATRRPLIEPYESQPIVCVLSRGERAQLTKLDPAGLQSQLGGRHEAGFDRLTAERRPVLEWLAARGGWKLTLSHRATEAVPLIRELVVR